MSDDTRSTEDRPWRLPEGDQERRARRRELAARRVPRRLTDLWAASEHYEPGEKLWAAVRVALQVGAPLLLTGAPGTGKTSVAYFVARYFGLTKDDIHTHFVRSTSTWKELCYRFDTVGYFHATRDPRYEEKALDPRKFRHKGPLWKAMEAPGRCVVLVDEIDKAPRDLPNDLLNLLAQYQFVVPETGERVPEPREASAPPSTKGAPPGEAPPPPFIVITSNSERRLPGPFLRRCIFHHIKFKDELVERAVDAHLEAGAFPGLKEPVRSAAMRAFFRLRRLDLRRKPATAELLVWLAVLGARGYGPEALRVAARDLPELGMLVKDSEDMDLIEQAR